MGFDDGAMSLLVNTICVSEEDMKRLGQTCILMKVIEHQGNTTYQHTYHRFCICTMCRKTLGAAILTLAAWLNAFKY